jgi:VanW like protein/Glycosyl transferases group 1
MPIAHRPSIRLPRAAQAAVTDRSAVPTRLSAAVFQAKVMVHRARRTVHDLAGGPRRLGQIDAPDFPALLGEARSPLWSDPRLAERRYQLGKVHNLRRAVRTLDRVLVPAGPTFSFWAQVGRPSRRRGYVTGRMLQQGCLVPATGGGLCQLSNALYQAALASNCLIAERHAHSRAVPGSAAAVGRDATVAWNYVDLRFRAREPLVIEARLTRDELVIRFRGRDTTPATPPAYEQPAAPAAPPQVAATCATCDRTACFRHEGAASGGHPGRTAYLLDECRPEFRAYVGRSRQAGDVLGIPLDGSRWRLARYRWDVGGFAKIVTAPLAALTRTVAVRRFKDQGPARRAAELDGAAHLAASLSRALTVDVTDACVAQSLLPFLWRAGHLGGRRFSVLLTRLPLHVLHGRLDAAAAAHPERTSLADFRAPAWMVAAEREALAQAEHIVTPHAELADMFHDKALRLDWELSALAPAHWDPAAQCIAFPGPTVARKGAFELREVARALDLDVMLLGSDLEGPDFWRGVRVHRPAATGPHGWLDRVAAVVQPAQFEERPRHLLAALAAGVPVIATAGCGLAAQAGLTIVPHGDVAALAEAVRRALA